MAGVTFLNVTAVSASVDACSAKCDDNNLWWLGVLLGLLGSIFINTGNNIQSLGLHQLSERLRRLQDETTWDECGEPHSPKTQAKLASLPPPKDLDRSVMWRCGTAVFLTGSLMNFASYGLAPAQLLAPLESIQFVTNICFSKFMLGKAITWKMYGGTLLIFGGTVLTVLNSSKCEGKRTISRLIELYTENEAYQVYLVLVVVMAASTYSLHGVYERRLCAGKPLPHTCTAMPVLYAWFSALFGTQSVVQAKCLAVLLGLAGERGAAYVFTNWFTYVCLIAWAALVGVWLYRMNAALGLYDPIFIVPLLQVDFILFAIISGGIYFREFKCFSGQMYSGFCCAIVIIFLGLFMLAPDKDDASAQSPAKKIKASRGRVFPLDGLDGICDDVADADDNDARKLVALGDAAQRRDGVEHKSEAEARATFPRRRLDTINSCSDLLDEAQHDAPGADGGAATPGTGDDAAPRGADDDAAWPKSPPPAYDAVLKEKAFPKEKTRPDAKPPGKVPSGSWMPPGRASFGRAPPGRVPMPLLDISSHGDSEGRLTPSRSRMHLDLGLSEPWRLPAVTSISAQYTINELDSARRSARRRSFDSRPGSARTASSSAGKAPQQSSPLDAVLVADALLASAAALSADRGADRNDRGDRGTDCGRSRPAANRAPLAVAADLRAIFDQASDDESQRSAGQGRRDETKKSGRQGRHPGTY
mmetsp:Transcript_3112/g.11139  ORF Transcript_3112/g.11139 Transcript_3112/m.11139 type:complete len:703 (-) Transcript_3112:78-2186(-)